MVISEQSQAHISPLPYLGQSNLPTDNETLLEAVWTACNGQGLSEGKFE